MGRPSSRAARLRAIDILAAMSLAHTDLAATIEAAPFCARLGARVESLGDQGARLRLPFQVLNSNPGDGLHGGVIATLIELAGAAAASTTVDPGTRVDATTLDLAVSYLSAAVGEEIVADARVLRRGKEIVFSAVDVAAESGKAIATGLVTGRIVAAGDLARFPDPDAPHWRREASDSLSPAGAVASNPMADAMVHVPYINSLGIAIESMGDAGAELSMAFKEELADAGGAIHNGALTSLVDTAGAMAAWSLIDLSTLTSVPKASTVSIDVSFVGAAVGEGLAARAFNLRQNREIFFNAVEVYGADSRRLVAHGSVVYRIVF